MTEQITHLSPTYTDHSGEHMTERLTVGGPGGPVALEEVLRRLTDAGADHPDVVIQVHSAAFSWVRGATDKEHQRYIDLQENQRQRTEEWERQMFVRLKEKYE